jgi:hypothetical protein
MVVSNGLFDALLFGLLLLGLGLDTAIPALHGAAFLMACGAALYVAAQEWSETLSRRGFWTQESLSTAMALSIGGFIYFRGRNGSDFSLLVMSIGLMMASLMVAIATLGTFSAVFKQLKPAPLLGYLVTIVGASVMGGLAGLLTLETPVFAKAVCVALAFAVWKARERFSPPTANPTDAQEAEKDFSVTPKFDLGKAATTKDVQTGSTASPVGQRWLIPRRGTLMDRFVPVLILGALLILLGRESGNLMSNLASPASANGESTNQVQNP